MDHKIPEPEKVDRYLIEAEIGRGGMATIYRALDPDTNQKVAIKVLHAHFAKEAEYIQRFSDEAKSGVLSGHPHLIDIKNVGEDHGLFYIVMTLIEAPNLEDLLIAGHLFSIEDVINIGLQLADALIYIHAHDIVHRDIKPSNILYSPERQHVWITDFGIARNLALESHTQLDKVVGTWRYMSPEHMDDHSESPAPVEGKAKEDPRSDLFSLGVVMYELLAGQPAFSGKTISKIVKQVCFEPIKDLRSFHQVLPKELNQLIQDCLEKKLNNRPASAQEVLLRLKKSHKKWMAKNPQHEQKHAFWQDLKQTVGHFWSNQRPYRWCFYMLLITLPMGGVLATGVRWQLQQAELDLRTKQVTLAGDRLVNLSRLNIVLNEYDAIRQRVQQLLDSQQYRSFVLTDKLGRIQLAMPESVMLQFGGKGSDFIPSKIPSKEFASFAVDYNDKAFGAMHLELPEPPSLWRSIQVSMYSALACFICLPTLLVYRLALLLDKADKVNKSKAMPEYDKTAEVRIVQGKTTEQIKATYPKAPVTKVFHPQHKSGQLKSDIDQKEYASHVEST